MGSEARRAPRSDARRNREQILDAAAAALGEDPSATVDDIARAAGVSRATLYRHFSSREQIIDEMRAQAVELGRTLVADHVGPLVGADGDSTSAVETVERVMWICFTEPTHYLQLMAGDSRRADEIFDTFRGILEGVVRRGQLNGELTRSIDTAVLAQGLEGIVISSLRSVAEGKAEPREAAAMLRRFLRGMAP